MLLRFFLGQGKGFIFIWVVSWTFSRFYMPVEDLLGKFFLLWGYRVVASFKESFAWLSGVLGCCVSSDFLRFLGYPVDNHIFAIITLFSILNCFVPEHEIILLWNQARFKINFFVSIFQILRYLGVSVVHEVFVAAIFLRHFYAFYCKVADDTLICGDPTNLANYIAIICVFKLFKLIILIDLRQKFPRCGIVVIHINWGALGRIAFFQNVLFLGNPIHSN